MIRPSLNGLLIGAGLATLGLSSLGTAARATDLPLRTSIPTFEPPPAPAFTWTGPYAGLVVGAAVAGDFFAEARAPDARAGFRTSLGGFTVGGTLGYNYQFTPGNGFVVGLEVDGGYSDFRSDASVSLPGTGFSARGGLGADSFYASVRGRAGYAFGPMLAYATGGWAVTEIGYSAGLAVPGFGLGPLGRFPGYVASSAKSTAIDGYVVGAGLEYAVTPSISLKAEYLYADFDRSTYTRFAGTPLRVGGGLDAHQIRIGANYRFSGFPGLGALGL